jgi:hypothetical protein
VAIGTGAIEEAFVEGASGFVTDLDAAIDEEDRLAVPTAD